MSENEDLAPFYDKVRVHPKLRRCPGTLVFSIVGKITNFVKSAVFMAKSTVEAVWTVYNVLHIAAFFFTTHTRCSLRCPFGKLSHSAMEELRKKLHYYIDGEFHRKSIFRIRSCLLSLYISFCRDWNYEIHTSGISFVQNGDRHGFRCRMSLPCLYLINMIVGCWKLIGGRLLSLVSPFLLL